MVTAARAATLDRHTLALAVGLAANIGALLDAAGSDTAFNTVALSFSPQKLRNGPSIVMAMGR